ncbi:unnamed protein product [Cochlearia groenlandica]
MYNLSRRMQSGSYTVVYRQGLMEILQMYNKVDRNKSYMMNPYCSNIIGFKRDYCNNNNQMSPKGLKLTNDKVNGGKYLSNGLNEPKMKPSPSYQWFNLPSWARWVIGSAFSLLLSFWNNKRVQSLKQIQGEAELAVEGVEAVAEMLEKVATATEEMAKEMAEKLPEESKLKQVALVLEHISEVTSHDAHTTQDFLHKVEKVTQDLDDLEAMIKSLVHKNDETKQQKEEANSKSTSRN